MDKTDEKFYCMFSHTNPPTSTYPASITTNCTSMGGVEAGTGGAHGWLAVQDAWGGGRSADGRRRRGHEVATASGGMMVAASRLDPTGSGRDGGGEATGEVVELEVGLGDIQGRWRLVSE